MLNKIDFPDIGKPMLQISYDVFYSNFEIEDFEFISDFKADLDLEYSYFTKARPVGRGGSAYELVVEFFLKIDLKTYLAIIGYHIANKGKDKLIDALIDKYLFKPFFNLLQSFSRKQGNVEICEFKIELFDSRIIIFKVEGISIPEIFNNTVEHIYKHLNNIVVNDEFPAEFVIPIFRDRLNGMDVYRPPLGFNETKTNISQNDYFKLWNLNYNYVQGLQIYNLESGKFIEDPIYMNEQDFLNEKYKY